MSQPEASYDILYGHFVCCATDPGILFNIPVMRGTEDGLQFSQSPERFGRSLTPWRLWSRAAITNAHVVTSAR